MGEVFFREKNKKSQVFCLLFDTFAGFGFIRSLNQKVILYLVD